MMADPDSCSMTPPLSPRLTGGSTDEPAPPKVIHVEESPEWPICFHCQGQVAPLKRTSSHQKGPLQRGALEKLLSGSDNGQVFESTTIDLFGFQFVPQMALIEDMEKLFLMLRYKLGHLEAGLDAYDVTSSTPTDYLTIRQQCRNFFVYVKTFVKKYLPVDPEACEVVLQKLLSQLVKLLVYMGRLSDLPPHVITSASAQRSTSAAHHLFHGYLDIYWSIIELLYTIEQKHPDACSGFQLTHEADADHPRDVLSQLTRLLLWDLSVIAVQQQSRLSLIDYPRASPFPCCCVQELCVVLTHIMNQRQTQFAKQSFWVTMNPVFQALLQSGKKQAEGDVDEMEIDSNVFVQPPHFSCRDPVGLVWWLLNHMAGVFQYDVYGSLQAPKHHVSSNYLTVQAVLRASLTASPVSEASLRCYLRCLISMSQIWEAKVDVIATLWDYFYKRLNDQFQVSGSGLTGLASVCKTSAALLDQCQRRNDGQAEGIDTDNSYQLFLRLVSIHLGKSGRPGPSQEWRQMKGRFYSRFHARKMQDLSEVGLNNFTCLFLTLASVADLEDVSGKLAELYDNLEKSAMTLTRRHAVWKGMGALIMLYIDRGLDCGHLADKAAAYLTSVADEVCQPGLDAGRYQDLWRLVLLYTESVQDIIERSPSLTLNQYKLIGPAFEGLLRTSRDNEMRHLLHFIQAVQTKHRTEYKRQGHNNAAALQHRNLSDALWKNFYKFVRSHACTQTPPPQLADVAAGFTMLTIDMPPSVYSGMKEDFLSAFQYFGWGDQVNPCISCRYLCHLLPSQSVVETLSAQLPNHEACLIQAWFRCMWQASAADEQMQELTRQMLKLGEMSGVYQRAGIEAGETSEAVVSSLIKALGIIYNSLQDFKSKMEFQGHVKLLLGDVLKHLAPVVKQMGPPEALRTTYSMAGHLVKHCASFLYIKSRPDCLLPALIDKLILPRSVIHATPAKPVNPQQLSVIKEYLYLFVQGLARLNYQHDPYVQRKVKEIVLQYMTRFPVKTGSLGSTASSIHPLLTSLRESCKRSPSEESGSFRRHVLGLLRQEYLIYRGGTPQHAPLVLNFITELFQKTLNQAETARDSAILLGTCLDYQLLCDNSSIRAQAASLTTTMVEAARKNPQAVEMTTLVSILEGFTERHLLAFQGKALRVLEGVATLHPELVCYLIPSLTRGVKVSEVKRGVGIDKQLRFIYMSLLQNLGPKGEEEKTKLLREST